LIKFTKTGENTCTKLPLNYQNGPEIWQMVKNLFVMNIKYTSIFHSKAPQNLPNWDFWSEKFTKLGFLVRKIYHLATLELRSFMTLENMELPFFREFIGSTQQCSQTGVTIKKIINFLIRRVFLEF
jgi:hypothetical protein